MLLHGGVASRGKRRRAAVCRCPLAQVPRTVGALSDRRGLQVAPVPAAWWLLSAQRCVCEGGSRSVGPAESRRLADVARCSRSGAPFAGCRVSKPEECTVEHSSRPTARRLGRVARSYLVDPASSHMLVSKTKPCMSKYERFVL